MNYRLQNNKASFLSKPIVTSIVILVIAGFFYFFMPNFISETVYKFARPIWNVKEYVMYKVTNFWPLFTDKEKLIADNLKLKSDLEYAQTDLSILEYYRKENEDLKKTLGRTDGTKRIPATVLTKPNFSVYDTLVIDLGENNGIKKGDLVAVGDFVIGEIRETYSNYSKAVLFSSPGEINRVIIADGISADAIGRGGGNFVAKLPKEISVNIDDLVQMNSPSPKAFGKVESIELTETSSFQFILFKLPFNMYQINKVEVIKN